MTVVVVVWEFTRVTNDSTEEWWMSQSSWAFPPIESHAVHYGYYLIIKDPIFNEWKICVYKYLGRDYSLFTGHNPRICLLFELCIIPPGIRHIVWWPMDGTVRNVVHGAIPLTDKWRCFVCPHMSWGLETTELRKCGRLPFCIFYLPLSGHAVTRRD